MDVCALVQLHCGGDFGGTCSYVSKLSCTMKVSFHLGSHARFVVMRCRVVIEMAHKRAPEQSCGVFRLVWELVSRPCSVYVHGGRSGM